MNNYTKSILSPHNCDFSLHVCVQQEPEQLQSLSWHVTFTASFVHNRLSRPLLSRRRGRWPHLPLATSRDSQNTCCLYGKYFQLLLFFDLAANCSALLWSAASHILQTLQPHHMDFPSKAVDLASFPFRLCPRGETTWTPPLSGMKGTTGRCILPTAATMTLQWEKIINSKILSQNKQCRITKEQSCPNILAIKSPASSVL